MSGLKIFICALAMISPRRPAAQVGQVVTEKNVYRTDKQEYCIESTVRVGRTWVTDEVLWERELTLEECDE